MVDYVTVIELVSPTQSLNNSESAEEERTPADAFAEVHNARMGHTGARRTYALLNQHFPGHRIPFRVVQEYVNSCGICQKWRLGHQDTLKPLVRVIKPEHFRTALGADTLTVSPMATSM